MEEYFVCETDSEQIKALKRRILNLEAQLSIQKSVTSKVCGGNLLNSDPIDLYPGEQLDFILSILRQIRPRCPEGSRPRDIIDSILSLNEPVGRGQEILGELERLFKHGYPSTASDLSKLNSIGFTYTPSRKHPKLRFHEKYMFILPGTPSEHKSGSKNLFSEISKCIAVYQKV